MRCDNRYIFSSKLMHITEFLGLNCLKYNYVRFLLSESIFHENKD